MIKEAYSRGVLDALHDAGIKVAGCGCGTCGGCDEKPMGQPTGKETRLRVDHKPSQFYNTKRTFERANLIKKEVGKHVPLK